MAPRKDIPDLSDCATPGAHFALRVTPKAASNRITCEDGRMRAWVTTVPEDGKATAAVVRLLARALGVAPTRLTLLQGATSRDKLFRLD